MSLTVRSPDGELQFRNLNEVRQALRAGLIGMEDEIQIESGASWTKASVLFGPEKGRFWSRITHWNVLTALLVLEWLWGAGVVVLGTTVVMHQLWLVLRNRPGPFPRRWW